MIEIIEKWLERSELIQHPLFAFGTVEAIALLIPTCPVNYSFVT